MRRRTPTCARVSNACADVERRRCSSTGVSRTGHHAAERWTTTGISRNVRRCTRPYESRASRVGSKARSRTNALSRRIGLALVIAAVRVAATWWLVDGVTRGATDEPPSSLAVPERDGARDPARRDREHEPTEFAVSDRIPGVGADTGGLVGGDTAVGPARDAAPPTAVARDAREYGSLSAAELATAADALAARIATLQSDLATLRHGRGLHEVAPTGTISTPPRPSAAVEV